MPTLEQWDLVATLKGRHADKENNRLTANLAFPTFDLSYADESGRIAVNGDPTSLDQFRGTPYIQADFRASRPLRCGEHCELVPFVEFFNLFNRNNAGQNFVANAAALPVPPDQAESGNITDLCADTECTVLGPVTGPGKLRIPAGARGDFFGPGTTVGIPFAAQFGLRLQF